SQICWHGGIIATTDRSIAISAKEVYKPTAMSAAKDRLVQTFRFLKELNELRNPVARDLSQSSELFWIDEWPVHPLITVRRGDRSDDVDENEGAEIEPLIRIERANLTPCPKPPEALDGWLKPG